MLRVGVHQHDLMPLGRITGRQVGGDGGFPGAAFLTDDCDDHRCPPPLPSGLVTNVRVTVIELRCYLVAVKTIVALTPPCPAGHRPSLLALRLQQAGAGWA